VTVEPAASAGRAALVTGRLVVGVGALFVTASLLV
jgi:hypothetical protein